MAVTIVTLPDNSIYKSQNDYTEVLQKSFEVTDTTTSFQTIISGGANQYIQLLKVVISVGTANSDVRFRCNGNVFLYFNAVVGNPIVVNLNHIPATCEIGQDLQVAKSGTTSQLYMYIQYVNNRSR